MFYEHRVYQALPDKLDALVAYMETVVLPYQMSKGVSITGSFVSPNDPTMYVWMRRFESEADRDRLYAAVYKSPEWAPMSAELDGLMDKENMTITTLVPTAASALH